MERISLNIGLQIKDRGSFCIDQILDFQPECKEQVEREPKAQGGKGQVNKRGPDHPGADSEAFGYTAGNLETPFLEIIEYPVEKTYGFGLLPPGFVEAFPPVLIRK